MKEIRMTHDTYPISEREKRNAVLAREAAAQGMVLLRNENQALPLKEDASIALFGAGAVRTVRGGTGSGDPFNGGVSGGGDVNADQSIRYHIHIMDSFLRNGIRIVNEAAMRKLTERYDEAKKQFGVEVMRVFAFPEEKLEEEELKEWAAQTDRAVYVLSRNSGEGNDRSMIKHGSETDAEVGDYRMSQVEKANLKMLRQTFQKVILVLNVGGPVEMEEILAEEPDSILLMSQAGQEGGDALYDVITGRVNPGGKLTDTWAMRYEDNPASATFAMNDGNVDVEKYEEGIYVGYRYFDTWEKTPAYEFGYGLSYTAFALSDREAERKGEELVLSVKVTNIGERTGREVVQVYVTAPESEMDMPWQELKGFRKTGLLEPGASERVSITVPVRKLASYSQEREAWILSAGRYQFRIGTSSRKTQPIAVLEVPETMVTELVYTELPLSEEIKLLQGSREREWGAEWDQIPVWTLDEKLKPVDSRSPYHDETVTTYTTDPSYQPVLDRERVQLVEKQALRLEDVKAGKAGLEELVAQMSLEELAVLNCGNGWGVEDEKNPIIGMNSESVPGAAGETTKSLSERYGIPSMVMADGPGGVRVTQIFEARDAETGEPRMGYHFCTAWPIGTLLAQSFDPELIERVGHGMAEELQELHIGMILGPGINIHRDPLCGRNFEYYSEDPYLSGICAAAMVKGIQSISGIAACIKHYAANNQETNRNAQDSLVDQRALREIYLKPFEIAIKESDPKGIMTAYNKVNSVPSGDSYALCTDLARGEWGFDGMIMTDWNGGSSSPWISMYAGNDLIMPGGPGRVTNILLALQTIMPRFDERGQVQMEPEPPFFMLLNAKWLSFRPDPNGTDRIEAPILPGHEVSMNGNVLLVDGEPLYTETGTIQEAMRDRENFRQKKTPATTDVAEFSADGTSVIYRGFLEKEPRLCRGDVERCAIHNLKVIMESV